MSGFLIDKLSSQGCYVINNKSIKTRHNCFKNGVSHYSLEPTSIIQHSCLENHGGT